MSFKNQTVESSLAVTGKTDTVELKNKQLPLPPLAFKWAFLNAPPPVVSTATYKAYASKMDLIRLFAIASIVWGHSLFGWEKQVFTGFGQQVVQVWLMQMGRIGTVSFFLISGFFFGDKVKTFTVLGYLQYRFFSLIVPWLIFIAIFVVIQLLQILSINKIVSNSTGGTLTLVYNLFTAAIFHAAFWFIPVSIISACLLIVCKKAVNKLWFGVLLGSITLFYSINLYHGWVSANHAKSFLGYAFFMWLGIQLKVYLAYLKALVEKLQWRFLLPAILLSFLLACREAWLLKSIGCIDAFASIRFSNGVVSFFIFLAILKIPKTHWVDTIKPHKYIYGVYLVHSVIILQLMPLLSNFTIKHNLFASIPLAVLFQLLVFGGIMAVTYGVVIAIKNSPLRFIVGRA